MLGPSIVSPARLILVFPIGSCPPADRLRAHVGQQCCPPVDGRSSPTHAQWDLPCSSRTLTPPGGETIARARPIPQRDCHVADSQQRLQQPPLAPTPALQSDEDVLPRIRGRVWIGGPDSTASCGSVRSNGHGHVRRPALHSGPSSPQLNLNSSQAPAGVQCPPERRNRLSVGQRHRRQTARYASATCTYRRNAGVWQSSDLLSG